MFKTLALTIALFGSAAAVDCSPEWTGLHSEGDLISYTETVTTYYCCYDSEDDGCAMGTSGCTCKDVTNLASPTTCQKGSSQTMVEDESYNYECKNGALAFCNDATYQPGNTPVDYSAAAWEKDDEQCDLPIAPAPAPADWDADHPECPPLYETALANDAIGENTIVSVVEGAYTIVYQCVDGTNSLFCPMSSYEPGKGKNQFYTYVWTDIGKCTGAPGGLSPEFYPENEGLTDQGGCPQEYEYVDTQDNYNAGDKVSVNNIVYECKNDAVPGPNCGQAGNKPDTSAGEGAWTKLGSCSGTIEPTVSPTIDMLNYPDGIPGCPAPYEEGTDAPVYEKDDKVSGTDEVGDGYYQVYKCTSTTTGRCGQSGYEPGVDDGRNPPTWTDAWVEDGLCQGTISPTTAPTFDALDVAAGCPDTLTFPNTIEEGDMVSVDLSGDVEMIYKCKVTGWCQSDVYEPGADPDYSSMAWEKIGPCTGTYGPTPAPLDCFDTSNYKFGSCATDDTEFDTTLPFATDVDHVGVCQCTDTDADGVPITEECEEGSTGCTCATGTTETCTYFQEGQGGCTCTTDSSTTVSCSPADGSPDCDCTYDDNNVPTCTRPAVTCERTGDPICTKASKECEKLVASSSGDIPITVQVLEYDEDTDYDAGSVIRIHAKKYKCKDFPASLWCKQDGYGPDDQYFDLAWSEDGFCPTVAPTPAPTDSLRVRYLRGE